jgi:MFS family permease
MIRRPGLILVLLTGLNLFNYIDRFVLAAVLPRIKDEFHLLDAVSGSLATMFLIGYMVTSPIFGALGDRSGRKLLLAVGVAIWSLATVSSGLAKGLFSLEVSRAIVGVGEASYATIAPTIIDDLAPPEKKGRWLAIFFSATPIGAALGYVSGGVIDHAFGWRAAFFGTGGPGLLLAALCLFIEEPKRQSAPRASALRALRPLLQSRLYVRAVLGYIAYTFGVGALGLWAPTFLVRRYHMELSAASMVAGAATVIGGAGGTALGGLWADAWSKRPKVANDADARLRGQLRICAIGSLIAAPLAVASFLSPTAAIGIAVFFVCELALFICTSPVNSVVLQSVPTAVRASAMAVCIFAIHLGGDLWSPPFLGALADRFPIQWAMMAIPVAVAISGLVWWSRLQPRPEPVRTP